LQVVLTNPTADGSSEDIVVTIPAATQPGTQSGACTQTCAQQCGPYNNAQKLQWQACFQKCMTGCAKPQPAQNSGNAGTGGEQRFQSWFQGTTLATIAFHPHVFAPQTLNFFHAGALMGCDFAVVTNPCSFTIRPSLQPQLGGFVVPYVPIAIIYQPPGCGLCTTQTSQGPAAPSACGSNASYGQSTKHGITLSWQTISSSGTIHTASPEDFLTYVSAAAGFASSVAGATPAGAYFKTVGTIADTIHGLYNQQTTTTITNTTSQTLARGWVITDGEDWNTAICQSGDTFVYLQDVLFVYAVFPIDPVSQVVTSTGVCQR
jgi:hypothetical protein